MAAVSRSEEAELLLIVRDGGHDRRSLGSRLATIRRGTAEQLAQDPRLQAAYLGGDVA